MKRSRYLVLTLCAALFAGLNLIAQQSPSPVDAFLKFDADSKEYNAKNGEAQASFTFSLTNVSGADLTISNVSTSCGCTAAKLPPLPWTIAAGTGGEIGATMNIAGKSGTVVKTLTVNTEKGVKILFVRSNIQPPPAPPAVAGGMGNREENQKMAIADRQAVFKGDCAKCHVEPAANKTGKDLYVAACGVCHESEHRATMVPNLHALAEPTNAEFWRNWIAHGKPGSLMPAFAKTEGGILTDDQISSLVDYLTSTIPSKPTAQLNTPAPTVH